MNVRICYPISFFGAYHFDGDITMNSYNMKLWMITKTHNSANHTIATERIKFFINNVIESAVFINQKHRQEALQYAAAGFNVVTLPDEPVDQLLGIILHTKLNAIMEGRIYIGESETSSFQGDNIVYLHGDDENINIPDMPAWVNSPDFDFCSAEIFGAEEVISIPGSSWHEVGLDWPTEEPEASEDNTVSFTAITKDEK